MILVALNEMYFTILYIIIASILHHIQKCAHFRHEHQFCCLLDRLHAQAVKNRFALSEKKPPLSLTIV